MYPFYMMEGKIVKRNSKVLRKDYSAVYEKGGYNTLEFYGLLMKKGKLRIDVKRYSRNFDLPEGIKKQRKTVYFSPTKKHRNDYMYNIISDFLDEVSRDWSEQLEMITIMCKEEKKRPAYKKQENVSDDFNFMSGISDHEEASYTMNIRNMMRTARLEAKLTKLIVTNYAQFVHEFVSRLEAVTIRIMKIKGYDDDEFDRSRFYSFFEALISKEESKKVADLPSYPSYGRIYAIWNFLKHNTVSTYDKLKKDYPEMIVSNSKPYQNGQLAIYFINWSNWEKGFIQNTIKGISDFFKELFRLAFDEDSTFSSWNYDDYFIEEVNSYIKNIEDPFGLDDCFFD